MKWIVEFEPPAQAEIAEAFDWYEEKSSNFPAPLKHFRQPKRDFGASFCGVFLTGCILSC